MYADWWYHLVSDLFHGTHKDVFIVLRRASRDTNDRLGMHFLSSLNVYKMALS